MYVHIKYFISVVWIIKGVVAIMIIRNKSYAMGQWDWTLIISMHSSKKQNFVDALFEQTMSRNALILSSTFNFLNASGERSFPRITLMCARGGRKERDGAPGNFMSTRAFEKTVHWPRGAYDLFSFFFSDCSLGKKALGRGRRRLQGRRGCKRRWDPASPGRPPDHHVAGFHLEHVRYDWRNYHVYCWRKQSGISETVWINVTARKQADPKHANSVVTFGYV